jgi:hypothetical protein
MPYACVYTHMSARSDEWPPTDVRADEWPPTDVRADEWPPTDVRANEWPPTDEWPLMLCARVYVFVDTTSAHMYTLTRTHVTPLRYYN